MFNGPPRTHGVNLILKEWADEHRRKAKDPFSSIGVGNVLATKPLSSEKESGDRNMPCHDYLLFFFKAGAFLTMSGLFFFAIMLCILLFAGLNGWL